MRRKSRHILGWGPWWISYSSCTFYSSSSLETCMTPKGRSKRSTYGSGYSTLSPTYSSATFTSRRVVRMKKFMRQEKFGYPWILCCLFSWVFSLCFRSMSKTTRAAMNLINITIVAKPYKWQNYKKESNKLLEESWFKVWSKITPSKVDPQYMKEMTNQQYKID